MSFISGNNNVYEFLQGRPISHLYALSMGIICGLWAFWFYFCYAPLQNSIMQTHQSIIQMHQQSKTLNQTKRELQKLQNSIQDLKNNVYGHRVKQSSNGVLHEAVVFLTECAQQNKLIIHACRLCTPHDKNWCMLNQITCEFSGSLDHWIGFFEKIKRSNKLLKCKKIELTHQETNNFSGACVFQVLMLKNKTPQLLKAEGLGG